MRFWLKWAMLALPLALCLLMWVRSYLVEEALNREGYHYELSLGISRGTVFASFLRAAGWKITAGQWSYHRSDHSILDDTAYLDSNTLLGFGYASQAGPGAASATLIELPIWFLSLLAGLPPLWLYRRHRKRRKTGFPI